jgi:translation initiation factor 3 subunit M
LKTVASALRLPSIFEFDVVLKSEAVLALGNHELLQLLRIFANGSVSEYTSWVSVNGALANEFGEENSPLHTTWT